MSIPFSDVVNNTGIIQQIEQNLFGDTGFGQISGNTQRLQLTTNYINEGYAKFRNIAVKSDGKWQFDDNNYTDYPFAVQNLVANQQDYQFPVTFLEITSVEIQNTGGVWYTLTEVDEREYSNDHVSLTQQFIIPSQPYAFNRTANSIFLLPAPNYSASQLPNPSTGGLKVKYKRPVSYFTYTDTTKVPGFADSLHPYLVNYATWKYALARTMPIANQFGVVVQTMEKIDIPDLYLSREMDTTKLLRPKFRSSH